jgi:hypothetical protein
VAPVAAINVIIAVDSPAANPLPCRWRPRPVFHGTCYDDIRRNFSLGGH